MKHLVVITFTSAKDNFEAIVDFAGNRVRVSQYGADFRDDLMEELLRRFDGKCDVIGISGVHPPVAVGRKQRYHPDSARFLSIPTHTPVVSGNLFRNTYVPWAIRNHSQQNGHFFRHQRIAFLSGLMQQRLAEALSEHSDRLYFADPYFHLGVPTVLKGLDELHSYARRALPFIKRRKLQKSHRLIQLDPWLRSPRFREFLEADIFVGNSTFLERFELSALKDKTVLLDILPRHLERELRKEGVRDVMYFTPDLEATRQEPRLGYPALEGLIQIAKKDGERLTQDDILALIMEKKLEPAIRSLYADGAAGRASGATAPSRKFAFIIHPLSGGDFFRHPVFRPLGKLGGAPLKRVMERSLSMLPGVRYGKITGVRSEATGQTTEGLIYTLFDTPKELLRQHPEKVYDKLVAICEHASSQGADIIGLGAFTKIVGDAGVTVAHRSPIPVTTGNSLSASATLWAARVAMDKMGILPSFEYGKRIRGTAMVVGATGSIGAVSAKLIAKVASRVVITGPRADKLLELKTEIENDTKACEVLVATDPDTYAAQCDLVVLSTSSLDGRVMDIMKAKPGAVICDVSRPLSIRAEDVIKRPDVLVIESGEVELPGKKVEISCDIGLDESVVYACLAETALLALEGRMETFTLSRVISYSKVKEIYDIARRHGARLATIRGPLGIITDQEIALCREHARKALAKRPPAIRATGVKARLPRTGVVKFSDRPVKPNPPEPTSTGDTQGV